jgi:phosphatidylglycerophosphatase A
MPEGHRSKLLDEPMIKETDPYSPQPERGWEKTFRRAALSWFGCGLSPRAPGTLGSLGAIPLGAVLHWGFGPSALIIGAIVIFFVGWGIAAAHLRDEPDVQDPQWIVIDEVAGQWLVLAAVPLHPLGYLFAFALFRFFDIRKPWLIGWADRNVKGALGIMLDDLLAGLYAAVVAFVSLIGFRTLLAAIS